MMVNTSTNINKASNHLSLNKNTTTYNLGNPVDGTPNPMMHEIPQGVIIVIDKSFQ
jgi:hypothetical protein